jgi:phospholipid/cholesterol/gamma-HCH transport system ATP-binding protein
VAIRSHRRDRPVSFGYDAARPVLHGVSLRIEPGSVVGIMGQSGCGKTTLLRIIAGWLKASAGSTRVLGQDVAALDGEGIFALRRKMGMLFQFGALFTDMTVFDNVAFQMREHTDLPAELVNDLVLMKLEAVGLRGAAQLMPSELSGGMARRVALARAIALDPRLMLYDEPFTGLDPISLGVIARLIRTLNDSLGQTSIVVSHDVEECFGIVDYVYFVSAGRIVAEGKPAELRRSGERSCSQFVRGEPDGPIPFHYPAPATRPTLTAEAPWLSADARRCRAARGLARSGRRATAKVWRLGFAARFFVYDAAAFGHRVPPLRPDDPRNLLRGRASLVIILVSGLFVGMVLGCRATTRCSAMARRKRSASWSRCRWCASSGRWSPGCCSRAVRVRPSPLRSAS